jgi:cob(I)alamin adenosyltransferase
MHFAIYRKGAGLIYYTQKRSGLIEDKGLGLIHIYFGKGVGKTTRAIGLAVRAAGNDRQVDFVQFMKSGTSSEVAIFKKIPNIHYRCPGKHPFIMSHGPEKIHYEHAAKALQFAFEAIDSATDLVVCDEILSTVIFDLLKKEQVLDLMERCRNKAELIMTGIDAPDEFINLADYVTEFVQIKHPYYSGARARKGIEY